MKFNTVTLVTLVVAAFSAAQASAKDIIHDAEHYILAAQHGERWAVEDKEIAAKLAALRKKHGTPPNIIHIMWDDTDCERPNCSGEASWTLGSAS